MTLLKTDLLNTNAGWQTQTDLEYIMRGYGGSIDTYGYGCAIAIISVGDHNFPNASLAIPGFYDLSMAWGKDVSQIPDLPLGKLPFNRYRIGDTCKIVFFVGSPKATVHDIEALEGSDNAPKNVLSNATPPDLSAYYKLADFVDQNHGQLPFSIREAYSQKYAGNMSGPDSFWFQGSLGGGPDHGPIYGHRYLAINSLGKSNLSAKEAAVLLDNNIEAVFPGTAKGEDESQIRQEAQNPLPKFKLAVNTQLFTEQIGDQQKVPAVLVRYLEYQADVPDIATFIRVMGWAPEVMCADVKDYHFTFITVPGNHILEGQAIHGVFKDSAGELWMFQQGRGPADESLMRSHEAKVYLTYTLAEVMWRIMASNLKDVVQSQSHP